MQTLWSLKQKSAVLTRRLSIALVVLGLVLSSLACAMAWAGDAPLPITPKPSLVAPSVNSGIPAVPQPTPHWTPVAPDTPSAPVFIPQPASPLLPKPIQASPNPSITPTPTPTPVQTVVPITAPNTTVIKRMVVSPGRIMLQALPGQSLRIKNFFTLSSPTRAVIDFDQTVLESKQLASPISMGEGGIDTVRLGQFDLQTVRLVIETPNPRELQVTKPASNELLLSYNATSWQRPQLPPSNTGDRLQAPHQITTVLLSRAEANSILLSIGANLPISRFQLNQAGSRITIALPGVTANRADLSYSPNLYAELKGLQFRPPANPYDPAVLVVDFESGTWQAQSMLSLDGQTLMLKLSQVGGSSIKLPQLPLPNPYNPPDDTKPVKKGRFTVVVDAGHGGKDVGANRAGVYEKNLNLSVALKVRAALEARGVTVVMTRNTDKFLELSEITGITNQIQPDAFVSVHTNSSVNAQINGLETYYFTPQSRKLADVVHRQLVRQINAPDRKVRTARFYVVHHTNVPAILCEMGYISHAGERAALQTEARQQATATAIAQGVLEFLKSQAPGDE